MEQSKNQGAQPQAATATPGGIHHSTLQTRSFSAVFQAVRNGRGIKFS